MHNVSSRRLGSIRSSVDLGAAGHSLEKERSGRAAAEEELRSSRATVLNLRTRIGHMEIEIAELRGHLAAAEGGRPGGNVPPAQPRKKKAAKEAAADEPVQFWAEGWESRL